MPHSAPSGDGHPITERALALGMLLLATPSLYRKFRTDVLPGATFHGALSGRENVAFLARLYGASVRRTLAFVEEFSELGEYYRMPLETYSAGMRARLAFGICLGIEFDVYLIDEVTEIGDERFRRKCASAFRERMRHSDIILATHNQQTIRQYCDRAAILGGGRLEMFDTVAGALERYRQMLVDPVADAVH